MKPVSKLPPVAVCVTLLALEKVTVPPLATRSVGGWKAKWLISTLAALLVWALVSPAEATGPLRPARARAEAEMVSRSASFRRTERVRRVVVIAREYGG